MKLRLVLCAAVLCVASACSTFPAGKPPPEVLQPEVTFEDEPAAHALYDEMVATMRNAESLYYESDYRLEGQGREVCHCTYEAWLKKPNYARVEAARNGKVRGVLVGDGDYFWIHWPKGRMRYGWEWSGERAQEYERTRLISYMKQRTPVGQHSIAHQTGKLGTGMSMTIIDPSTFHGYTDALQPYVDGVRGIGEETVEDEECDAIEVSFMDHQRSWYMWLSKRDHLPRRLKQVVRVSFDVIIEEIWSNVTIDGDMETDLFAWKPPDGWEEWRLPAIEEGLLEPGTEAPDFELASADGGTIKLSDYRGKIIWFYIWRAG